MTRIRDGATTSQVPLPDLLRMCKLLAKGVQSDELANWASKELQGYDVNEQTPEYRVLQVQTFGDFIGGYIQRSNTLVAPTLLPAEYRAYASTVVLTNSTQQLQSLLESDQEPYLKFSWDANAHAYLRDKIFSGWQCLSLWRLVSKAAVHGTLDNIRTRILDFVMEIEEMYPETVLADLALGKVEPQAIRTMVFQNFYGGQNNVLNAGDQSSQSFVSNVTVGNWESLRAALASFGVGQADIEELRQVVDEDAAGGLGPGPKVQRWIQGLRDRSFDLVVSAAGSGIWQAIVAYRGGISPDGS